MKRRVCRWVSMDELLELRDRFGVAIEPDYSEGISYAEHDGLHYAARMDTNESKEGER
jgi:hypothetical protein